MQTLDRNLGERFAAARDQAVAALLEERDPAGHWTGELSSSALATATAVCALAMVARNSARPRPELGPLIRGGLAWLAAHVNADGGWGDTVRSFSNISTTTLVWAAFGAAREAAEHYLDTVGVAEKWLVTNGCCTAESSASGTFRGARICPARLARQIAARYGKDRTFSIPILTMCAISGRLGEDKSAWRHVIQLPFELAALPAQWFGAIRLPVVSYALPALIAIGQVRHHFRPTRNPLTRLFREAARKRTLRILASIQPKNGGFLEATPLTAFVTMSLAAMGLSERSVAVRGTDFLVKSVRSDGSWAIDSNLNTWVTTLAVNALGEKRFSQGEAGTIRDWLLAQQYRQVHPYTNAAPGGWAWTSLPGGVPDADDTAGALLALRRLGPADEATRRAIADGARWLMDLQNRDGGIPTFCKGWGALPFDRSSPDITAHALRAWVEWMDECPSILEPAISRALRFLAGSQKADGSWIPLWFGHQESADDENPLYGTARVLTALWVVAAKGRWPVAIELAAKAERWLLVNQNPDGGWAGAPGAASTVEETALAIGALAGAECDLRAFASSRDTKGLTRRREGAKGGRTWRVEAPANASGLSAGGAEAYQLGASPQELHLKNDSGLKARSIDREKMCIGPSALVRILRKNLGRWPRLVCGQAFGPKAPNTCESGDWERANTDRSGRDAASTVAAASSRSRMGNEFHANARELALGRGISWLVERVESGQWQEPAPIGFYFARLWYFERLYPFILAAGAFEACDTHATK
ncbi:MAG: prenyltransferase/squalene oxidase repeat-containing protein [Verrucomicrobiota bacterium]